MPCQWSLSSFSSMALGNEVNWGERGELRMHHFHRGHVLVLWEGVPRADVWEQCCVGYCQMPAFGETHPSAGSNEYSSCREQMDESHLPALSTPRVHMETRYFLISISSRRRLTTVAEIHTVSASISHFNALYTELRREALREGYFASICKTAFHKCLLAWRNFLEVHNSTTLNRSVWCWLLRSRGGISIDESWKKDDVA